MHKRPEILYVLPSVSIEGPCSIPAQSMWNYVVDKVALRQVFPPNTPVFPCQFHSTGAPLLGKIEKKTDHFSLHLHHKVAQ